MASKKVKSYTFYYLFYLLVIWTIYRFFFGFSDVVEELLIKPAIWLLPIFFILKKEGKGLSSIGITNKNLFKGIYFALGLGAVFAIEALLANFAKYNGFNFSAKLIAMLPRKQ